MILFGDITEIREPSISWGKFKFSPAVFNLRRLPDCCDATYPDLNSVAGNNFEKITVDGGHESVWVRGRIAKLFGLHDSPVSTIGETILSCSDETFVDVISDIRFPFVAATTFENSSVTVPFVCVEGFGEASLAFGDVPIRNSSKYIDLFSNIASSFWALLLNDIADVEDYIDRSSIFEKFSEYGIHDGQPFFRWIETGG